MNRIHFVGYTAGSIATDIVMPDGTIAFTQALVVGISTLYTLDRHRLPWPPLTVLLRFDGELVKHAHNPFTYATSIAFDGMITHVRLLDHNVNVRQARRIQHATRRDVADHLRTAIIHWLPDLWASDHAQLERAFTRYQHGTSNLDKLLDNFQSRLAMLSDHQRQFVPRISADARRRAAAFEQQLDALDIPQRFMLTDTRKLTNGLYNQQAFTLTKKLHLEAPDTKAFANVIYRRHLFNQYRQTQTLLEQQHFQLNPPQPAPISWTPEDLHTYMPLGLLQ